MQCSSIIITKRILRLRTIYFIQFTDFAMQLSDNLSSLMKELNIDDKVLSEKCSINAGTIKKIRLGQSINPTLETLLPIAKFFDISVSQLIGETPLAEPERKNIPLLLWADLETKIKDSILIRSHLPTNIKSPPGSFATHVTIDKYDVPFKKNTTIIVDPEKKPSDNDYILCLFNNQLEICKLVVQFGQTYIVSMVPGMQNQIKISSLDNFLGTIIETRNLLRVEETVEEPSHLKTLERLLTVIKQKLILN